MGTNKLTGIESPSRIGGVKKHIANLPIDAVTRAFQTATQQAAVNAVAAGRVVVGWENGRLTEYGPGAHPLLPIKHDEGRTHGRAA